MGKQLDIRGLSYNRLTVLSNIGKNKFGKTIWSCVCTCGNLSTITTGDLRSGNIKSCGCLKKEVVIKRNLTHGETRAGIVPRLYTTWSNMRERCLNKRHPHYKNYGGRCIKVCHEWMNNYVSFSSWARTNGYKENLTLDRIDNNKGYSPKNCRWVTRFKQNRNLRNNVRYKGEIAVDASIRLGGGKDLVSHRINKCGWSTKDAFTLPAGSLPKHK